MKIKLAGADFTFPLLSHDKSMALISLLGLDGIDIGLFEKRSHLQPSAVFQDTARSAGELHKKLDDLGLEAADIFLQCDADFTPMASNHPDATIRRKARDWFMHSLEFSRICKAGHTTGLPGVYFDGESEDSSYKLACEELAWRLEKAREYGIVFSIEPHLGSIVPKPALAAKLVKDVPGLSLTLDYTHFTKIGIPDEEVEPLIPYASHFHARGAAKGYLQTSFQKNTIDYGRILRRMQECAYPGYIGIEYIWIDWENCNEVDNVAEITQLKRFIENYPEM